MNFRIMMMVAVVERERYCINIRSDADDNPTTCINYKIVLIVRLNKLGNKTHNK